MECLGVDGHTEKYWSRSIAIEKVLTMKMRRNQLAPAFLIVILNHYIFHDHYGAFYFLY